MLMRVPALFLPFFIVLFTLSQIAAQEPGYDPVPISIDAVQGEIRIPMETVGETITKYVYRSEGIDVRFFLVRGSDGEIRSSLDACRICGPAGFEQIGTTVVCKRCGVETEIDDIGEDVSCNPIPLGHSLDSGDVVIPVANFLKDRYIWTDY